MKQTTMLGAALAIALGAVGVRAAEDADSTPAVSAAVAAEYKAVARQIRRRAPVALTAAAFPVEPADGPAANSGFATTSAFAAAAVTAAVPAGAALRPASTSVAPPVTMTYSGSPNTLTVSNNGIGKAILATINNTSNTASALYGQTTGAGAGLTGYNGGTSGPAGKFGVTNAASAQPAVAASTSGTGSAISGISTSTSNSAPAILGRSAGVYPNAAGIGVQGEGQGAGVNGIANVKYGIGVKGTAAQGFGIYGYSSGTGIGVYGASELGPAGLFDGPVEADSFDTSSDVHAKTHFETVDRQALLDKVAALEITSWAFKKDTRKRHLGPMAQDFHAAFGLDGTDDTHISLTDIAGVSLAAIQEVNLQLKRERQDKDAKLAALQAKLDSQTALLTAQTQAIAALELLTTQFRTRLALFEAKQDPSLHAAAPRQLPVALN